MPNLLSQGMYVLAPLVKQPDVVPLPTSMYSLPPIVIRKVACRKEFQSDGEACVANGTSEASRSAGDVAKLQLSARQEAVLARLQGLQLQLDQLKSKQPQAGVQQNRTASSLPASSQFQGKSSSKYVSDAVSVGVLEQHHAVLHKLLLLQHRLSKLIRQPGCPLWRPDEQSGVCHDLVIRASPQCPPYSVLVLAAALRDAGCTVLTSSLLHSSLQHSAMPAGLQESFKSSSVSGGGRADHQIVVSVVWSDVVVPSLMVSPLHQCPIVGEANIIRYLCRLLPATSPYHYEADASFAAIAATDQLLDSCSTVLATGSDKRATPKFIGSIEARLKSWREGTSQFGRCGDAGLWSALKQLAARGVQLTPSVARWLAAHDSIFLAGVAQ